MNKRPGSWITLRESIIARDQKKCLRCGHISQRYYIDKWNYKRWESDLRVDHILPLKLGGDNNPENLQTLCIVCAEAKNNWDQHLIAYTKRLQKMKLTNLFATPNNSQDALYRKDKGVDTIATFIHPEDIS